MSSPHHTSKETWQKALNNFFEIADEEFDAHYASIWAPDLKAVVGGKEFDFTIFRDHIRHLRASMAPGERGTIRVEYLVCQGTTFATRHTAVSGLKGGKETHLKLYGFGELNEEGQVRVFDQAVILVAGVNPHGYRLEGEGS